MEGEKLTFVSQYSQKQMSGRIVTIQDTQDPSLMYLSSSCTTTHKFLLWNMVAIVYSKSIFAPVFNPSLFLIRGTHPEHSPPTSLFLQIHF